MFRGVEAVLMLQKHIEKCFVVFVFIFSTSGALFPLLHPESDPALDAVQSNPVTQPIWGVIYLVTFLLVLLRWKRLLHVATIDQPLAILLVLLVGVVLASVFWSVAPGITLRKSVALAGTTLFGAYLATRYSLREQLQMLAWALGIQAVLSLLFALALPSYGISSNIATQGDWRGIFVQKNVLGQAMTLSVIVFLLVAVGSGKRRWVAWAGVGLSCSLLWLSNSITGLLITLILLALWPLYKALRWRHTVALPFLIIAVLLGGGLVTVLLSDVGTVLSILGRDDTLTGRTNVWAAVLDAIRERPWLGYGYSAFWLGWEGPSAQIWLATGFEYVYAHNGILDLWLELGLLGIALFALGFSWVLPRAVIRARYTKTPEGLWPLMFLSFFLLYNLTESMVLRQNSIYWILYVATVLSPVVRYGLYDNAGRVRQPQTRELALK